MAYDEGLAQRIRDLLEGRGDVDEKKMFGGLAFLVRRHMACGINGTEFMGRVGPARYDEALAEDHAREMDFTGRSLKGYVYVSEAGIAEDSELARWVGWCVEHAEGLPPKP